MRGRLFDPPLADVAGEGDLLADLRTTLGTITVRLFEREAPKTVGNFVGLATGRITGEPFYDGLIFHRVMPEFMIQLGCPDGIGTGGPGYVIKDELHPSLRHDRPGVVSMANAGPGTGGSQFFITEKATPWLDGKHAIFGEVVAGIEVVRQIARQPRDARDKPRADIRVEGVDVYRG